MNETEQEYFVQHGFVVLKKLVDPDFCQEALERVKIIMDDARPFGEWTNDAPGASHEPYRETSDPVLRKIFDQPRLREAVSEMHGGPQRWNKRETFYLFVKPYDPNAEATLSPTGHIDFGNHHIPILYRGFVMFVALADTEPFSGNTMVWPGTHRIIQKQLIADPKTPYPGPFFDELNANLPEPYEFVAEAGDVLFMHHLALHSGNHSHSKNRIPRIALCVDAWRDEWLTEIDPADNLPPWPRSLAQNGAYKTIYDERAERAKTDPEIAAEDAAV